MGRLAACLLAGILLSAGARGDALVGAVAPGSAAARAGLRPGDVLLQADGVATSHAFNLRYCVERARAAGRPQVTLRIRREGRPLELRMALDPRGLQLVPYDPPDRLRMALERGRTAALKEQLDLAPGVALQLLTRSIERSFAGDARGAQADQALAGLVASELPPLLVPLTGARRRRLEAELARLRRRLALVGGWGGEQRTLFIYAMRFQKAGVNFYLQRNPGPVAPSWRKALELYRKLGDDDNALQVLANLGLLHQRHGKQERAVARYREAWRLAAGRGLVLDLPRVAHLLGGATGDPDEACAVLGQGLSQARALGLVERRLDLAEALILAQWRRRRPGAAEAAWVEACELAAGDRRMRLLRMGAGLARDTGRVETAIERLQAARRLAPGDQAVLGELAGALLDARRFEAARAVIDRLARPAPFRARFHRTRARAGGRPLRIWTDHLASVAWAARAGRWREALAWLAWRE